MDAGETFSALIHGRGSFRFVLQPIIAILLGIRDGRLDASAHREPFFLSLFTRQGRRQHLGHELIRAIAIPFTVAIIVDMILQRLITQTNVLWISVLVGTLLVGLPYSGTRGLANRWARHRAPAES